MPTLTITFTNDQADRIQAAFVERLNIPDPNMGDLKQWVVNQIRAVVLDEERAAAIRAVQQSHIDAPFDPS